MAETFRPPWAQFEAASGVPLAGAKLYFYEAGSTTEIDTYQDNALGTPHLKPVVADAAGMFAPIFIDNATNTTYKVVLHTSADVPVQTIDNIVADVTVSASFLDNAFEIKDNSDPTKIIAFQASGITTGTTRTFTAPDASGTLALTSDILDDISGTNELYIPATAFTRQATNGAAEGIVELATTLQPLETLDFDTTTQEFAVFQWLPPKRWDRGTITFQAYWTAASGSGTAGFLLEGVAISNDDALNTAYGTAVAVLDTLITANDLHISPVSNAVTIAGTPADGDLVWLRVKRDVSTDDLGVDAKLIGVKVFYTVDQGNDA